MYLMTIETNINVNDRTSMTKSTVSSKVTNAESYKKTIIAIGNISCSTIN